MGGYLIAGARGFLSYHIFLIKVAFYKHTQPSLWHGCCPSCSAFKGSARGPVDPLWPCGSLWAGSWWIGLASQSWAHCMFWVSAASSAFVTGRAGCSVTVRLESLSDSNHNTLLGIVRVSWPVPSLLHATSYFVWVSKCHLLQVTYASPWDLCPGTPLSRALPPQVLDVNSYCVMWFIPVHAAGGRAGHCCGAGSPAWHHTWWARGRQ